MISTYRLSESDKWDQIVKSFINYDIYWLSGYVRAFQIHGDGEPLLIYYQGNNTKGINVVMKRDIAKDSRFIGRIDEGNAFDFTTPYGYGGWIIEGNGVVELFFEYSEWTRKNNVVSEFVRFHPMLGNHIICEDYYEVKQLGEVVHMDLISSEVIWKNLISKNRNMIRKAQKNGIKIYNGRFPGIFERFREIYNETMEKDNAKEYYFFEPDFYTSILNDLPNNAQMFWAEKDNQVIAVSIILGANSRLNYHLSGSKREYSSLAPGNLLLYKVALWGCENGFKTLYLGGGVGSGVDSLFKFKRAFYRGDLNHFYIGKRIFDNEKYFELMRINRDPESDFFPGYRA